MLSAPMRLELEEVIKTFKLFQQFVHSSSHFPTVPSIFWCILVPLADTFST